MTERKPVGERPLTAQQVRTARAWLGLDQGQLAAKVGLSRRTIANFELGNGTAYDTTMEKLRNGLTALGVEWVYENGVPIGLTVDCRWAPVPGEQPRASTPTNREG